MTDAERKIRIESLRNIIKNYRDRGDKKILTQPRYVSALSELDILTGGGFEIENTVKIIRQAAIHRRYISYKDVAGQSQIAWERARYSVFNHLGTVSEWGYLTLVGKPLLSATVVTIPNIKSGKMDGDTLRGFIRFSVSLGVFPGGDETAFLLDQQEKVFAWAASGRTA